MRKKLKSPVQKKQLLTAQSTNYNGNEQAVRNFELLRRRGFSNLKILRYERGLTLKNLSELTKISPSYLSRLECGARRLNTDLLGQLANVLGCDQAELLGTTLPENKSTPIHRRSNAAGNATEQRESDRDLPLYRLATAESLLGAEETMTWVSFDLPTDWAHRPRDLMHLPKAFGLCVADNGYAPHYRTGDIIFVHPTRPLSSSCIAFVVCTNGKAFLRRFVAWSSDACVLQELGSDTQEELAKENIRSLQRVTGCLYA